jgi:hypothetical protein
MNCDERANRTSFFLSHYFASLAVFLGAFRCALDLRKSITLRDNGILRPMTSRKIRSMGVSRESVRIRPPAQSPQKPTPQYGETRNLTANRCSTELEQNSTKNGTFRDHVLVFWPTCEKRMYVMNKHHARPSPILRCGYSGSNAGCTRIGGNLILAARHL